MWDWLGGIRMKGDALLSDGVLLMRAMAYLRKNRGQAGR